MDITLAPENGLNTPSANTQPRRQGFKRALVRRFSSLRRSLFKKTDRPESSAETPVKRYAMPILMQGFPVLVIMEVPDERSDKNEPTDLTIPFL